jgi:hypothetical protein
MARHRPAPTARGPTRRAGAPRRRDGPGVVLNAAARFLELRSRSVDEVRRHLTGRLPAELVEGAIARLLELGMLDDRAFAQAWVESRDRARPRGERAPPRARSQGHRPRDRRRGPGRARRAPPPMRPTAGSGGAGADELAAKRLLAKNRAALCASPIRAPAAAARLRLAGPQRLRSGRLPRGQRAVHRQETAPDD